MYHPRMADPIGEFRKAFGAAWAVSGVSARGLERVTGICRQTPRRMYDDGEALPSVGAMVRVCMLLPEGVAQPVALMAVRAKFAEWGLGIDVRHVDVRQEEG